MNEEIQKQLEEVKKNYPNIVVSEIDITDVKAGYTVFHCGKMMTVCQRDIDYSSFCGTTLFGYNYMGGRQKVIRIQFRVETANGVELR